jgi:hypothetical protein
MPVLNGMDGATHMLVWSRTSCLELNRCLIISFLSALFRKGLSQEVRMVALPLNAKSRGMLVNRQAPNGAGSAYDPDGPEVTTTSTSYAAERSG